MPDSTATPSLSISHRKRWLQRLKRHRQALSIGLTLLLFSMALIACRHLLQSLDHDALHNAMADVPGKALLGAAFASVIGFIILLGYEWSASRYA
ncbi:MAG: hypothetical protein CFE49_14325, partial [Pseudomonas sp. PGPPP3]